MLLGSEAHLSGRSIADELRGEESQHDVSDGGDFATGRTER